MTFSWLDPLIALCLSIASLINAATAERLHAAAEATIVVRPSADPARPPWLYESDQWSAAVPCATGNRKPHDHREIVCRFPTRGQLTLDTGFGPVTLTAFATRSDYSADGTYGLSEDVVLVDAQRRLVATLIQWEFDVHDASTTTRRRRMLVADLDADGADEVCVENGEATGSGLFELLDSERFIVSTRHVARDALTWNGDHLVRSEFLDGLCPTKGYRMLVTLPLNEDPVHSTRDA